LEAAGGRDRVQRAVDDLALGAPPGEMTHWVGWMLAKAAGVSLRSLQRILEAHQLAPHRMPRFLMSAVSLLTTLLPEIDVSRIVNRLPNFTPDHHSGIRTRLLYRGYAHCCSRASGARGHRPIREGQQRCEAGSGEQAQRERTDVTGSHSQFPSAWPRSLFLAATLMSFSQLSLAENRTLPAEAGPIKVETVAERLEHPWGLAFLSPGSPGHLVP